MIDVSCFNGQMGQLNYNFSIINYSYNDMLRLIEAIKMLQKWRKYAHEKSDDIVKS